MLLWPEDAQGMLLWHADEISNACKYQLTRKWTLYSDGSTSDIKTKLTVICYILGLSRNIASDLQKINRLVQQD